jgi:hypothetical protein
MQFKNEKCIVLNIEIKKNIEINKIENLKLNLKKKKMLWLMRKFCSN